MADKVETGRQATFVVAADGTRLMPTFNVKKVRKLLRSGKAKIVQYRPYFAIQLNYMPENIGTLQSEISVDAGSEHIGISAKSEKHEYLSEQRDNLNDEKKMHDAQATIRHSRRNRKRYREARFDNRKKEKGWLAPSLEHKKDSHVRLIGKLLEVFPATDVWLEMGSFDTQALAAIEQGKPIPQGTDYQQGPQYKFDTLREAVLYRDNYKCLVCGRSCITDGVAMKIHHIGFRFNDHTDRMYNLASVCEFCHIPANHKEGGALWDFKPTLSPLTGAAFMNSVRWIMLKEVQEIAKEHNANVHMTYGAVTKRERKDRNLAKSHANDAYCIDKLHPMHRVRTQFFKKKRRNNRCLQKFVDAVYIDVREGSKKKGSEIGCNRDNRKHPRNWDKNLRVYRGQKVSKGGSPIRRRRYDIRPGDPLLYTWTEKVNGQPVQMSKHIISAGTQQYGKYVTYNSVKEIPIIDIAPKLDSLGQAETIVEGNKYLYIGGRERRKPKYVHVYKVDNNANTVTVNWTFSVPALQVTVLNHTNGWEKYTPKELYTF